MKNAAFGLLVLSIIGYSAPSAHAAGKGYASARTACLAQAGTNEAEFSARRASYQSGAIYKQCMTGKGHNVNVLKGDGTKLF
jgi:hypothetical protein